MFTGRFACVSGLVVAVLLVAGCQYVPGYDKYSSQMRSETRALRQIEKAIVSFDADMRYKEYVPAAHHSTVASGQEVTVVSTDKKTLETCRRAFRGFRELEPTMKSRSGRIDIRDVDGDGVGTSIFPPTVQEDFGPDMQRCYDEVLRTGTYTVEQL